MSARATDPRHLFICGLHRSGTSPFHRLLRLQPGVSGFEGTSVPEDEGQHLQSAILPALDFGGPGRFAFDPGSILTARDADAGTAERLRADWHRYWDHDAEWLLEKSPPNLLRMPFLQAVYPDASFVVLVRHPVAVSLATKKWAHTSTLDTLLEHWLLAHEVARASIAALDRVTWLSFEDFVASPGAAVRAALDLPGDAEVAGLETIRRGANDAYHQRWENHRASRLRGWHAQQLIGRFEGRVRRFGYSLVDLAMSPASQVRGQAEEVMRTGRGGHMDGPRTS